MKALAISARPDPMNGLEARYAVRLGLEYAAKEIQGYGFHRHKLKLGDGAWYTPDFDVIAKDGQLEFHETKGFMREAANVRIKVAATLYPQYVFRLVRYQDKCWEIMTI